MSILLGIDRFASTEGMRLRGDKIGILCHAASVDQNFQHLTEICRRLELNVQRCFGPEHGIWADAQDMEAVDEDPRTEPNTGAPISSLYGHTVEDLTPKQSDLIGLDWLVIDLQDIGTRYYTYIYTAALCARACAQAGVRVMILDRPNPLGGLTVEGGLTSRDYLSFVGLWPLPNRHGLTLGEVVLLLNERESFGAEIEVIKVQGWSRDQLLYQTGQRWVQPSPNMPNFNAMALYPGLCLIEGTELSEGRGTTRPFEWIGADFIEPFQFAQALNQCALNGIHFRPLFFKPTFHKFAHQTIGGVELHVTNPHTLEPLKVGLYLLHVTRRLYGDALRWRERAYEFVADRLAIDLLFGGPEARMLIDQGGDIEQLWARWKSESETFKVTRMPYLLYPEEKK